jgi:hypothetical protein
MMKGRQVMTKYITCVNAPGTLPEAEPGQFEDFEEAKRDLIRQIEYWADSAEEPLASNMSHFGGEVNFWSEPQSAIGPDGMAYEILEVAQLPI